MTDSKDIAAHIPVLLKEVLFWLQPRKGGTYVDGTFGRGGYSRALLDEGIAKLFAIDRDAQAIKAGTALADKNKPKLTLIQGRFGNLDQLVPEKIDGAVFDIGVSSPQLDEPARGFSFRHDGPLDMRMGQEGESAEDAVNDLPEKELADIIFNYGEERFARRVAKAIVEARSWGRITGTLQLAKIIRAVVPSSKDGLDPATRSFQALRVYVNQELDELENGLKAAQGLLKKNGRLVVVSFHSIEDRIVKNFFRAHAKAPALSRYLPTPTNDQRPTLKVLTAKPVTASREEVTANPRAASAKLRAAIRICDDEETESFDQTQKSLT